MFTHRIHNDGSENRRGYFLAIFGVFCATHHGVVAVGEHTPNGAEDDDCEGGYDDAVGRERGGVSAGLVAGW